MSKFIACLLFLQVFAASVGSASSYEDWLRVHQSTIVKLNRINYSHIVGLRQCACFQLAKEGLRGKNCSFTDSQNEPLFLREVINFYGQTVSEKVSCETILERLVYKRLKMDWQDMRFHLALMQAPDYSDDPVKTETMQDLSVLTSFFGSKNRYLFATSPEHEIQNLPFLTNIEVASPESLSEAEISLLLEKYFSFSNNKCQELAPKFLGVSRWTAKAFGVNTGEVYEFCEKLIYSRDGNIPLTESYRLRKYAETLLLNIRKARAKEFRDYHRDQYRELIQSNPLLALVRNPDVDLLKLSEIFTRFELNAKKRLEDSVEHFKANLRTEVYGGLTYSLPYTQAVWGSLGLDSTEFGTYSTRALSESKSAKSRESLINAAAVVGMIGVCVVPWGKVLTAPLQILKSSCLSAIGVPLNSYFLIDSVIGYRGALEMLFSSFEANQALEESMVRVDENQTMLGLTAITLPIGMNLVETREVLSAIKKIGRR